jgi:hypothetical protein
MNRRGFLGGLAAAFAWLLAGRWLRRTPLPPHPDGFRRLSEPCWIEPGEPIGLVLLEPDPAPWTGRIVRQPSPAPGQIEKVVADCGDPCTVRSATPGTPERAYIDKRRCCDGTCEAGFSFCQTANRLASGELRHDEVFVYLLSADELATDPSWGGKWDDGAPFVQVEA